MVCAIFDTWCQNVWHQTDDEGPHTYPMLCIDTMHWLLCPACSVGWVQWATGDVEESELEVLGVKQDLFPYVGQLVLSSVPSD